MATPFKIKKVVVDGQVQWVPANPELASLQLVYGNDDMPPEDIRRSLFENEISISFPGQYSLDSDLEDLRAEKFAEIDLRTQELIAKGMPYGGKIYSLSANARDNYSGMLVAESRGFMSYPITFNTLDDLGQITIENAGELDYFCGTAMGVVKLHTGSGTALKKLVREATTPEELAVVVDDRPDITLSTPEEL